MIQTREAKTVLRFLFITNRSKDYSQAVDSQLEKNKDS